MPGESQERKMVLVRDFDGNVNHDASYWYWKFLRREDECEELADRLQAAEARAEHLERAIQEVQEELGRRRDSAESVACNKAASEYIEANYLGKSDAFKAALDLLRQRTEQAGADSSGPGAEDCERCGGTGIARLKEGAHEPAYPCPDCHTTQEVED